MEIILKTNLAIALTLSTSTALAIPVAPFNALEQSGFKHQQAAEARDYDFEGIVKLSNCSGALIAFNGQPLSSNAIVMTNGHCIDYPNGYLKHGEVLSNRPVAREMEIFDRNMELHSVLATRLLYATMTNTDIAFYELNESFNDIYRRTNIRPFLLDSARPLTGISIDIISGYWDRGYSCNISGFVFELREDYWVFKDSIRYTEGCNTVGGTSGSPIIARGERIIVGINNTSNENGNRCTRNNPCEVDRQGDIKVRKGVRYGQQTYNTYTCLTPNFRIDLNQRGCTLPR